LDSFKPEGEVVCGYKVLGDENKLPSVLEEHPDCSIFVAIGDNWIRSVIVKKILELTPEISFASVIHPSAQIGNVVSIGKGVAVMPGVIINSESIIKDFCIVNTKASVGHESVLEEFSSLASNVTLGGGVQIGAYSAISISATIIHGRKIGSHTVIGAGSIITKDFNGLSVVYGSPGKTIRERVIGESYL